MSRRKKWSIGKKIMVVVLSALLTAVLVVGGLTLWFGVLRPSPVQKTLHALFPPLSVLEQLEDGGSISLSGDIDGDLIKEITGEPLNLALSLEFCEDDLALKGSLGSGNSRLEAQAVLCENALWLESPLLGQTGYRLSLENLEEKLAESPLHPDSGSDYAIPQALYDELCAMETRDEEGEKRSQLFADAIKSIVDRLEETPTWGVSRQRVRLTDGEVTATVMQLRFDAETVSALSRAVIAEWESNAALREALLEIVNGTGLAQMTEVGLSTAIKSYVTEMAETATAQQLTGSFSYAEYKGYWVWAKLDLQGVQALEGEDARAVSKTATLRFSKDPDVAPAFDLSYRHTVGKEVVHQLQASYSITRTEGAVKTAFSLQNDELGSEKQSYRVSLLLENTENGSLETHLSTARATDFDRLEHAAYQTETELTLGGTYLREAEQLHLSVNRCSLLQNGKQRLQLERSAVTLEIGGSNPQIRHADKAFELSQLHLHDLQDAQKMLEDGLETTVPAITDALGCAPVTFDWKLQEKTPVALSAMQYAYDAKTQRLFLLSEIVENVAENSITVYAANGLQNIGRIQPGFQVKFLFADAGVVTAVSATGRVRVYDAETLRESSVIEMTDTVTQCYVDGNWLIFVNEQGLYRLDLKTKTRTVLAEGNFSMPSLTADLTHHTVLLQWGNLLLGGKQRQCLSVETGEVAEWLPVTLTLDCWEHEGYTLLRVLYADSLCGVTRETDAEGKTVYGVYLSTKVHAPIAILEKESLVEWIQLSDGTYLACEYLRSNGVYRFTPYTLDRKWTVDLTLLLKMAQGILQP